MLFKDGDRIIFTGDSVTDDHRRYPVGDGDGLGVGFVMLIDTMLSVDYPQYNFHCYNMGISGNTTRDLLARWDDINALNPDWVVIEIGVNDVWRQFDSPWKIEESVMPDEYRDNLNAIIKKTKAKIIIMSPYYLEPNKSDKMRARTDEYVEICKDVARRHNLPFIDLQAEFDKILKYRYPGYIAWDRVHPGRYGSLIIARAFMNFVKNI